MQNKIKAVRFRLAYFLQLIILNGVILITVIGINKLNWLQLPVRTIIYLTVITTSIHAINALMYNILFSKDTQKTGYVFLTASMIKLLLTTSIAIIFIKKGVNDIHSLGWILILYYSLLLVIETVHKIKILNEINSFSIEKEKSFY